MKRILLLAVLFAILGHGDCGKPKKAKTLAPRENICTRICTRKCFRDTCSYVWSAATSWCPRRARANGEQVLPKVVPVVESKEGPGTKHNPKGGKQKSNQQKKKEAQQKSKKEKNEEGAANAVEQIKTALDTCPIENLDLFKANIQKVKAALRGGTRVSDEGKEFLERGEKSLEVLEATKRLDEEHKILEAACNSPNKGPNHLDFLEARTSQRRTSTT